MKKVAKIILFDNDDKMLVLRRSGTHPDLAYHLDFPGGEVEPDEEPHVAVLREAEEEVGLTIHPNIIELVHEKVLSEAELHLIYKAKLGGPRPEVTISWEHDQSMWMSHEELRAWELPPLVDDFYMTALEYLEAKIDDLSRV